MEADDAVLVAARDPAVVETLEVSAIAMDVALQVVQGTDELARRWPRAPLRLVAPEMAARTAWLGHQPRTFLVGRDPAELADASAELGYPVVRLPDAAGRLAELFASVSAGSVARATTVALVGASGGLGTSTCAVALGLLAAARGQRAVVVELAPHGGGLDLLVGAEAVEGLRWGGLAGAAGQLGDLQDSLLEVGGARFLPAGRDDPPGPPAPQALGAVLGSLRRTMDLVVLDGVSAAVDADLQLLVVGADVRSVAAARMLTRGAPVPPAGLVVRTGPGRDLPAGAVAEALGAPLVARVRHDPTVPRLAALGQIPVASPARRFRADVEQLRRVVVDG
ncbi:septum site-determining protein Ssd [Tessaracoccus oleiagri]|uniref:Helicase/secretion neighborhood CpaE-like protein n=1 Tax=Tessaracoccus oleiagri TaxID=686624 RepID=A0A1G9MZI0_9ACTN|nr:septum site-determining protein Ssd [Tessaracoccus oleiagri]SDL79553.1 helicase/secretion neighborhood CpaE-like protein [Tessaracoccus oleiagri]